MDYPRKSVIPRAKHSHRKEGIRATTDNDNFVKSQDPGDCQAVSQVSKLTGWSTSWSSFANKIIMKRRQTTMLRVSGRGLGLQASESTLTQFTSQRTDPKNKKQLLGLPRST